MESRRKFLKKALYVAPIIVTAAVRPAFACTGYRPGNVGRGASLQGRIRWTPRGGRR